MARKNYLSEQEFADLKARLQAGGATIHVSKSVARQFFFRVDNASIRETTGRSMLLEKSVIITGVAAAVILLLVALASIIRDFGWGAAIAAPLVGIFWTVLAGFTSDRGNWIHGVAGFAVIVPIAWVIPATYGIPTFLVAASLLIQRLTFSLAQRWVETLVADSFAAYDMLAEHVTIEESGEALVSQ